MSETLNLNNFQKLLSKIIFNKAKTLVVRDLDIENKNTYIAYVDEGNNSYDVSIKLKNDEITAHNCDCSEGSGLCEHKVALMIFVKKHLKDAETAAKTAAKPKKVKAKTGLDLWMDEAKTEDLKAWCLELIKKDAGLKLAFEAKFGPQKTSFTPAELTETMNAVYKTLGRKQKITAPEVKRFTETLDMTLKPALELAHAGTWDDFNTIYGTLLDLLFKYDTRRDFSGVKYDRFCEAIFKSFFEKITQGNNLKMQNQALGLFLDQITGHETSMVFDKAFFMFYESVKNTPLVTIFADLLYEKREKIAKINYYPQALESLMHMLVESNILNNTFADRCTNFPKKYYFLNYIYYLTQEMINCEKIDEAFVIAEAAVNKPGAGNKDDRKILMSNILSIIHGKRGNFTEMTENAGLYMANHFDLSFYLKQKQTIKDPADVEKYEKRVMKLISNKNHRDTEYLEMCMALIKEDYSAFYALFRGKENIQNKLLWTCRDILLAQNTAKYIPAVEKIWPYYYIGDIPLIEHICLYIKKNAKPSDIELYLSKNEGARCAQILRNLK